MKPIIPTTIINDTTATTTTMNASPISQSQGEGERRTQDISDSLQDFILLTNYDITNVDTSEFVQLIKEKDQWETVSYINTNLTVLYNLLRFFIFTLNNYTIRVSFGNESESHTQEDLLAIANKLNKPVLAQEIQKENSVDSQIKHCSIMLKILGLLPKDKTDATIFELHKHLAYIYLEDSNHKNVEQGLHHLNAVYQIHKKISPDDRSGYADTLFRLGKIHRCLDTNSSNTVNILLCFEESLKIYLSLVSSTTINYTRLSEIYTELGHIYKDLKDYNKAFDCDKKAHSLSDESSTKVTEIKSLLQTENIDHFGICFRPSIILLYGEIDRNLALLKQKIQTALLDPIVKAVEHGYGWSYIGYTRSDWGVKGYIDWDYVKKILTGLGEKEENIEPAQMLCFEAMNLAILKLPKKPYEIITEFTNAYPDLIEKIANEHPEFFVDASIVKACQHARREMREKSNYTIFYDNLFKDTDYFLQL